MRTATLLSAVLAAGISLGAGALQAQTSANVQATATVLSAVTVAAGTDLQFGNVTGRRTLHRTPAQIGAWVLAVERAVPAAVALR